MGEIDAVEELPEGWAWTTIGEIASPSKDKVEPGDCPSSRYLSLEHIESETGRILNSGHATDVNSTKAVFSAGDLLYGKLRPYLNKVAIPEFDGICSTDILVFPKTDWLLNVYLRHFLSTRDVVQFANHHSSGVQLPRISFAKLGELPFPLPPLAEQKRVVAKVEALLARVNAARQRLAKVPALLKRFRQSVLAAACSGQLTEDWREENQDTEPATTLLEAILADRSRRHDKACRAANDEGKKAPRKPLNLVRQTLSHVDEPDLPEAWEGVVWNDLADWITYGYTRPMPHVREGIPILSAKNVRHGALVFDDIERTTTEAFASLSEKDKPRRGEILITKDGAIRGRAALVETDDPFCITQAVAVVRFGGITAVPSFLLRVLQSPRTQKLIEEESSGTAIPHISITDFGRFPVPLPPLAEQHEIVRRVEALLARADRIEKRLATATRRVETLTQAILAKAFRGELVPTEAELARREGRHYEPAAVLLERIRAARAAAANGKETKKTGKKKPS